MNFGGGFGRSSGMRSGFSFAEADDIFRRAFGGRDPFEDFFGDDDDFGFFGGFGSIGGGMKREKKIQQKKSNDPFGMGLFNDDFFTGFGSGFGGGFGHF